MCACLHIDLQPQVSLASCRRVDLTKVAFAEKDTVSARRMRGKPSVDYGVPLFR